MIYKYIFEEIPNAQKVLSPFLQKGLQAVPIVLESLVQVGQREDLESLILEADFSEVVVEIVEMLNLFVGEKDFYDFCSAHYKSMLVNISLILMRAT
jgi:tRNA U38,U39,U40 pseudouridine synthase TruA